MAGTVLCSAALMAAAVNCFADMVGARQSGPESRTIQAARQQGSQGRGAHVRAVVTYYDTVAPNLFVQDETGGIWVDLRGLKVQPPQVGDVLDRLIAGRNNIENWHVMAGLSEPMAEAQR